MTPGAVASGVTEQSFAQIRAHPGFRSAVERAASESVLLFQSLEPGYQWITKDVGRAGICVTALVLHLLDRLTVQTLTAACLDAQLSSAGRVQEVVRRCQTIGAMSIDDGPGPWTRRRLRVREELIKVMHERAMVDFSSALMLAPELAAAESIAATEAGFVSHQICVSALLSGTGGLFNFDIPPIDFFLEREAGMLLLFDFIGAGGRDRSRLLESAPISRYALSRRYGVSRAHINKLLSDTGLFESVDRDRATFSELLSDALDRHFGIIFLLNRCAAEVLISGWRYDPTRSRR